MNPEENKTCAICLRSVVTGQGQAIFTAECSHSFHFSCIGNSVTHGNYLCPLCRAPWNELPLIMRGSNPDVNAFSPYTSSSDSPQTPVRSPTFEPNGIVLPNDEPLSNPADVAVSSALQNVTITAIPERPVVAASVSAPCFAVLVGLKAPPLTNNVLLHMQRAPVDLVAVLDVSGSMHGSKLALLKRAVKFVIDNLGPSDKFSLVSFSTSARRIFPLHRMVERKREDAKWAVNALSAMGMTNIVDGLTKGVEVLEERQDRNPVASIIFLSDGQDTCNRTSLPNQTPSTPGQSPPYLRLLPASICPGNRGPEDGGDQQIFPVYTFGFGLDHDPIAMHDIADSSGGTFSFIESYEMVQDAFANCIGGLLSVVTQELRLMVRSASHRVEILSIPSGKYASEITDQRSQGTINVGDLYAEEEKEFLINLSVPTFADTEGEENDRKTSLLDITCSYKDAVTQETVQIEGDLVEIQRPEAPTPPDNAVNLVVDRQRNRVLAAATITDATQMAEAGNLTGAQTLLSNTRSTVLASPAGQAHDDFCMSLEAEMKEMEERMATVRLYQRTGRAFALANMSAHGYQRATTRGYRQAASNGHASDSCSSPPSRSPNLVPYGTPNMARMVQKSRESGESSMQR